MKQKFPRINYFFFFTVLVYFACNNQVKEKNIGIDSTKVKAWNALFKVDEKFKDSDINVIANQPVKQSYAKACMQAYRRIYDKNETTKYDSIKAAFTKAISFPRTVQGVEGVEYWINGLNYDNGTKGYSYIKIKFGVYVDPGQDYPKNEFGFTQAELDDIRIKLGVNATNPKDKKLGRLTAFLCASDGSVPLTGDDSDVLGNPFNLGTIIP